MWRIIDKEMELKNCSIFCYLPEEDPFDGEDGAIWSFNYFFFNKDRKRVCYIYLRGLSMISHSVAQRTPIKTKRDAESDWGSDERPSSKRARFWLGDRAANATSAWSEDDEDSENCVDSWNNDAFVDNDKQVETVISDEGQIAPSSGEATSPSAFSTASPESIRRSRNKNTIGCHSEDVIESVVVSGV